MRNTLNEQTNNRLKTKRKQQNLSLGKWYNLELPPGHRGFQDAFYPWGCFYLNRKNTSVTIEGLRLWKIRFILNTKIVFLDIHIFDNEFVIMKLSFE